MDQAWQPHSNVPRFNYPKIVSLATSQTHCSRIHRLHHHHLPSDIQLDILAISKDVPQQQTINSPTHDADADYLFIVERELNLPIYTKDTRF
jgi:hypothetical protein